MIVFFRTKKIKKTRKDRQLRFNTIKRRALCSPHVHKRSKFFYFFNYGRRNNRIIYICAPDVCQLPQGSDTETEPLVRPTRGREMLKLPPETATTVFTSNYLVTAARRIRRGSRRRHPTLCPLDFPKDMFTSGPFFAASVKGDVKKPDGAPNYIIWHVKQRLHRLWVQKWEAIAAIVQGRKATIQRYTLAGELAYVKQVFKWFTAKCAPEVRKHLHLVRWYEIRPMLTLPSKNLRSRKQIRSHTSKSYLTEIMTSAERLKYKAHKALLHKLDDIIMDDQWMEIYSLPPRGIKRIRWARYLERMGFIWRLHRRMEYNLTLPYTPYIGPHKWTWPELKEEDRTLFIIIRFFKKVPHYNMYANDLEPFFKGVLKVVPLYPPSKDSRPPFSTWLICVASPDVSTFTAFYAEAEFYDFSDIFYYEYGIIHENNLDYEDYTYNDLYSREVENYGSHYEYERIGEPISDERFIYSPLLAIMRARCFPVPAEPKIRRGWSALLNRKASKHQRGIQPRKPFKKKYNIRRNRRAIVASVVNRKKRPLSSSRIGGDHPFKHKRRSPKKRRRRLIKPVKVAKP